ncbi:MAG: 4Fe-4S dicluster domain-containing protein [Desulfobacteraceae bacterium]|nr:MAG: 4Fe-4S dicluster domain-containing protein [Desulfobacteraceae bacterium]
MARIKLKELRIERLWCKGCGICVAFCPTRVLEMDAGDKAVAVRVEDCTACGRCALRCPDLAITVEKEEGQKKPERKGAVRRGVPRSTD